MKKLEEKDIGLLQRKRIIYLLDHEKKPTPSKEHVMKEIAKDMKVTEDLIKIRHIYPHFGTEKAKIIAHVYKTKEALKRFEEINKKKKVSKGKKAETPKVEVKKEVKAEAPKKEIKVEEKKVEKVEVKESGKEKSKKQETK